jgi:hypothetical protein
MPSAFRHSAVMMNRVRRSGPPSINANGARFSRSSTRCRTSPPSDLGHASGVLACPVALTWVFAVAAKETCVLILFSNVHLRLISRRCQASSVPGVHAQSTSARQPVYFKYD